MDTIQTSDAQTEPDTSRARTSLATGIFAAAVYLVANPLIYLLPLTDWLPPGPSSGMFAYLTLPMLLCLASAVLGVVAIITGRAALRRPTARAYAGAGIALGVASLAQSVIYLVLLVLDFAAM
ncbi:hypothetical protein [Agromyces sp. NPDC058064]|uniref:hypothetical protein n=1 Tax=Agromyces sp. NPDC058064 TaxID=3346322 RepID=UPI0036DC8BCE